MEILLEAGMDPNCFDSETGMYLSLAGSYIINNCYVDCLLCFMEHFKVASDE